jgi:hypothetical protein
VDCVEARETIGVWIVVYSGTIRIYVQWKRTVCESRRRTFMADGTEMILETYVSTAFTTSMALGNYVNVPQGRPDEIYNTYSR